MPVSVALLTSAAALLLLGLGLHGFPFAQRIGRNGFAMLALGSLIPLLDPLLFLIGSEDQIGELAQPPIFAGPLPGLALIVLSSSAEAAWRRRGLPWRAAAWASAGLLLHMVLMALTSGGTPWLAPFWTDRWAWPLFAPGHPLLVSMLVVLLVSAELRLPRWKWLALGLLALYVVSGACGRAWAGWQGAGVAQASERMLVEPDGWAPWNWMIVREQWDGFELTRPAVSTVSASVESKVPRWNDQPTLLRLLEDPLVRSYFYRVFRHPVAAIDNQGAKVSLTLRELADVARGDAGPTFTYTTDWTGRSRVYQLTHFD